MSSSLYFTHARLALAAYANLNVGLVDQDALLGAGLTDIDARQFGLSWRVIDQFNSSSGGLSATVFQELATGKRYLAIRGTDDVDDLLTDFVSIAVIGTPLLQPQFILLKIKIEQWLASGVLPDRFTVTGHSLGGFLATAVAAEFSSHVEHTYLYNAPGLNGMLGNATAPILRVMGVRAPIDPSRVSNIKADAGLSLIAGLGGQVAPPVSIVIEPQSVPFRNHSQSVLVDSLAVYGAFQALDRSASLSDIGRLLKLASYRDFLTLESSVHILGKLFGQPFSANTDDRDSLYERLARLREAIAQGGYGDSFRFGSINNADDAFTGAISHGAQGLAYRYALKELNPFALLGTPAIYSALDESNQLDLFDPAALTGYLTAQWLQDRAEFLIWKNQKYEKDIADDIALQRKDDGVESYLFTDKRIKNASGGDLGIRVLGGNVLQRTDPIRITFGDDQADNLTGGRYADHLYGEGGDDSLAGGEGDDYLEGGSGFDTYDYSSQDDLGGYDKILDVDGQGSVVFDGRVLNGGSRILQNRYRSEDGLVAYSLVRGRDGGNSLIINDVVEVENFHDGALGITLEDIEETPQASPEYELHYQGNGLPLELESDELEFRRGSDLSDEYIAGRAASDDEPFSPGLEEGDFSGRAGNDKFLGSYILGGDYASGGPGDDFLDSGAVGDGTAPDLDRGDEVEGGPGRDVVRGGPTDDRLYGDAGLYFASGSPDPDSSDFRFRVGTEFIGNYFGTDEPASIVLNARAGGDRNIRLYSSLEEAINYTLGIDAHFDPQTAYDDTVEGEDGSDYIVGGNGSDYLAGGEDNDEILGDESLVFYQDDSTIGQLAFGAYARLLGSPGNDVLHGNGGDDFLKDQFGGDDELYGDDGDDTLRNADGPMRERFYEYGVAPRIFGAHNILDGGEGDDTIGSLSTYQYGFDRLYGGAGNDYIGFAGPNAEIEGGEGDDFVEAAGSGSIFVNGGAGDDSLSVASAYAEINPGEGNDTVTALGGYLVLEQAKLDVEEFDQLILADAESFSVDVSRNGDDLVFSDRWDDEDTVAVLSRWFDGAPYQFDTISFNDGITWTPADVMAFLDQARRQASEGNDVLTANSPVVRGLGGEDTISAAEGAVFIDGGSGDDLMDVQLEVTAFLAGGRGNDSITAGSNSLVVFNRGDGADAVLFPDGGTISIGGGIAFSDIAFIESGEDMLLDMGSGDSILLIGAGIYLTPYSAPLRLQIISADHAELYDLRYPGSGPQILSGSAMGGFLAQLYALDGSLDSLPDHVIESILGEMAFGVSPQSVPAHASLPPVSLGDIGNQIARVGEAFDLSVPAAHFIDLDTDNDLTIAVMRPDGTPLPGWLKFDPASLRLLGTPASPDAGTLELIVTATDADGLATGDLFTITVEGDGATPNQTDAPAANEDTAIPDITESVDQVTDGEGGIALEQVTVMAISPLTGEFSAKIANAVLDQTASMPTSPLTEEFPTEIAELVMAVEHSGNSVAIQEVSLDAGEPESLLLNINREDETGRTAVSAMLSETRDQIGAASGEKTPARKIQSQGSAATGALEGGADLGMDGEAAAGPAGEEGPQPLQTSSGSNAAEPGIYGLSSWDITNALLQFHLAGNATTAAEDAMASGYATARTLSGMGFSSDLITLGTSGFASIAAPLQVFSGLQEGLARLGEVRIA